MNIMRRTTWVAGRRTVPTVALLVALCCACGSPIGAESDRNGHTNLILSKDLPGAQPAAIVMGDLVERDECLLVSGAVAVFVPPAHFRTPRTIELRDRTTIEIGSPLAVPGGWIPLRAIPELLESPALEAVRRCAKTAGNTDEIALIYGG